MAKNPHSGDEGFAPSLRGIAPAVMMLPKLVLIMLGLLATVLTATGYWWFGQRIEVAPDELVVLYRKVGQPLPASAEGQVVLFPGLLKKLNEAPDSTRYKGVYYQPLTAGRHFRDPFVWGRAVVPVTVIGQDEVGILVRKFGSAMPPGKAVTDIGTDERGPIREVLKPGRHNINTFAYDVKRVKPVVILAGKVGVQTLLSGAPPQNPNVYVVATGELGTQPEVLPPGLYYNNPYEKRIDIIDVRSHMLDLRQEGSVQFPSNDSFLIQLEATVEYAVQPEKAPYVMVAIGEHPQVVNRIILPNMNSLSRIEGSKLYARDFIGGETRTAFQNRIFSALRQTCREQGIDIRAVLIRRIVTPAEISGPISDRQVADQQVNQYTSEMKVAKSDSLLVEQEEMQKQNKEIGEANREVVSIITEAEQLKSVALTEARKRLAVAKLTLDAAREQAAAIEARGQADADVMRLEFEAQARPLRDAVAAFGDGESYAQFHFYQKLAPSLKNVLDSTDGPLADVFRSLVKSSGSAPRPAPVRNTDRTPASAPAGGN